MLDDRAMDKSYSISQVAKRTGRSIYTLRYYERIGLLSPVSKNQSGHRRYSETDLSILEFVTRLRLTGMPVRLMKRYFELRREGDATLAERKQLLADQAERIKDEMRRLQGTLKIIKYKLDRYDELQRIAATRKRGAEVGLPTKTRAPMTSARSLHP